MHLGPPVIHCLGNTPGRIFPPSGCGNCAQANCIEQTTASTAKRKNLVALIMTPVWRWLDSALKGTSRPLLRSNDSERDDNSKNQPRLHMQPMRPVRILDEVGMDRTR